MIVNYRNTLLVVLLILFFSTVSSKKASFQEDNKAIEDSIRKYIYNNPERAINYIHKFINQTKNKDDILMGYGALGVAHNIKNDVDSTLYYLNKALLLCEDPKDIITFKYDIGKVYEQQYNYEYALLLYKQCYDLVKEKKLQEEYDKVKHSLALMENKIGQPEKALSLLRDMYNKEKKEKGFVKNLKFTRKNLSETYLNSKKPDSALFIAKEGLTEALARNNVEYQYHFYILKAKSLIQQRNFKAAQINADSAIAKAKQIKNRKFENAANYQLALVKQNKEDHFSVITTLKSVLESDDNKSPEELSKYYKLLATSYDAIDSSDLSVNYYKKFTTEQQKVTEKRLATLDNIYDIDLKEKIIEKEKQESKSQFWLFSFVALGAFGLLLYLRIRKNQRKNQKLFDDLMLKVKKYEDNESKSKNLTLQTRPIAENIDVTNNIIEKEIEEPIVEEPKLDSRKETTTYVVDDEKTALILEKIKLLEEKKYFLKQDCNMHNMAKRLKTNTSYLSQIINKQLDKTFSSYINELRINYVILELKNNKRLRAYSVKGISEEIGYKSADSFSKYFKEATGLTPSVYIKKVKGMS